MVAFVAHVAEKGHGGLPLRIMSQEMSPELHQVVGIHYSFRIQFHFDTVRSVVTSDLCIESLLRFFQGREVTSSLIESYISNRLAVLVPVELQHCTIGDLPEQEWKR